MKQKLTIIALTILLFSCKKEQIIKPTKQCCQTIFRVDQSYYSNGNFKQDVYYKNDCNNQTLKLTLFSGSYKIGDKKCN